MAGELLYSVYAWAAVIVAVVGVLTTMMVTDGPDNSDTASGLTAIAVTVFTVALAASLAL